MPAGRLYGSPRKVAEALTEPRIRVPESARELILTLVTPAVRRGGWLCSPGTTHYVSDQGNEAWVTVVTHVDDSPEVREELTELLSASAAIESRVDALLAAEAHYYRAALQSITHVGLDVLEAGAALPLTEGESIARPSEAAPLLASFLGGLSPTYRRACPTYDATERFWLTFFRRGPAPEMAPPGHWLWNLAG